MNTLVFLFALAAVFCFVAAAAGWGRGVPLGFACVTTAVLLLPSFQALP